MGLSDAHKVWRAFKTNNPTFARPKEVKLDFGGELDKLVKYNDGWAKGEAQVEKYFDAVKASTDRIKKALDTFDKTVTTAAKKTNNARLADEFGTFKKMLDAYLTQWDKVIAARAAYTKALADLGA